MSSASGSVPRLRASRYGWATVALVAVAVLLLVWELSLLSATTGDLRQRPVLLPLDVRVAYPGGALLAAVTLLVLTTFVGLAALQTSAAMQILSPDRTIPPPPPPAVILGSTRRPRQHDSPPLPTKSARLAKLKLFRRPSVAPGPGRARPRTAQASQRPRRE